MVSSIKTRLDLLVTELGIAESRDEAQRLIRRGAILVEEVPIDKPGTRVAADACIRCRYQPSRYVSRGGEKLERALDVFGLSVQDCGCADLGASTGGFVDCLLQHGAKWVYAVDVGAGQLHERLRTDPRVRIMDRTNARCLTADSFGEAIQVVTMDLSFISVRLVLPAVRGFLSPDGWVVVLVKPQFEIGKGLVGKGGVVRDPADHCGVLDSFLEWASMEWTVQGVEPSPVRGKNGNIEFLAYLKPGGGHREIDVVEIVKRAHESDLSE
ncbi:MAG TPA: TlyA family RNA methyltransferase [bacterium]|mgnify:CR=1 FL=1|nr:TlyA family RNA methyltransferase [bacterium]HQO34048.1 TlyA family RNA methyltransferase [bacterium]